MIAAGARFLRETYEGFAFDAEQAAEMIFLEMSSAAGPTLRQKSHTR
jgi:hypothetical protein